MADILAGVLVRPGKITVRELVEVPEARWSQPPPITYQGYLYFVAGQWWDVELARAYALYRARRVYEDSISRLQAPGRPVPAYLEKQVEDNRQPPRMQLEESQGCGTVQVSGKRARDKAGLNPLEERRAR